MGSEVLQVLRRHEEGRDLISYRCERAGGNERRCALVLFCSVREKQQLEEAGATAFLQQTRVERVAFKDYSFSPHNSVTKSHL